MIDEVTVNLDAVRFIALHVAAVLSDDETFAVVHNALEEELADEIGNHSDDAGVSFFDYMEMVSVKAQEVFDLYKANVDSYENCMG